MSRTLCADKMSQESVKNRMEPLVREIRKACCRRHLDEHVLGFPTNSTPSFTYLGGDATCSTKSSSCTSSRSGITGMSARKVEGHSAQYGHGPCLFSQPPHTRHSGTQTWSCIHFCATAIPENVQERPLLMGSLLVSPWSFLQ